jgi:D-sedoheptulose 7-phosphate isomerase
MTNHPVEPTELQQRITADLWDSSRNLRNLAREAAEIERAALMMVQCLKKGGKILACGNGGSAADAQHLSAELSGRFEVDRPGLAAMALTTNTSTLTAIANDYDYLQVFSRQITGFMKKGDVLVAISTSGNSANVLEAVKEAKKHKGLVIGWTGKTGGKLKDLCDVCLCVPHARTSRIQEGHLAILHALCAIIESEMFPNKKKAAGYE